MKRRMGLTGEVSDHKVAGIFHDTDSVRECHAHVVESLGLKEKQARILRPGNDSTDKTLEPEPQGIWHTLVRAHVWLGLAGAVIGALIFILLLLLDVAFIVGNPVASALLLVIFCAVGGSMIGGAVTLRPDHTPYIVKVKAALRDNKHVLVVHPTDRKQLNKARELLGQYADDTVVTF